VQTNAACVKSNLGLVCITTSDAVRYTRTTRKKLLTLNEPDRAAALRKLYAENAIRLERAVDFCLANDLRLYRISSDIFQFSDEPFGREVLNEFTQRLAGIGTRAIENGIRLVMHPDQFVVLSSDSEDVVANSVKILGMHANTLDMLGQPRSEWAATIIHGGKSDRPDRMVESILRLPEAIRSRLVLENDEFSYSSDEILEVCRRAGVPMVFDAHHHVCHEKLDSFDHPSVAEFFWAARETWSDQGNQMVHISNGRGHFNDRAHSDLIEKMPEVYRHAPWIEVEAKHKEIAIEKLRREWLEGGTNASAVGK
jgi:UV DNA damage endonuclease